MAVAGVFHGVSGFVIVPVLTLLGGLAMREAIGTSLLVIAMNSLAGVAGTATHTTLDGRITAIVTCLAVAGSFAGVRAGRRLSAHALQGAFGWFVIIVGVIILARELC